MPLTTKVFLRQTIRIIGQFWSIHQGFGSITGMWQMFCLFTEVSNALVYQTGMKCVHEQLKFWL